MSGGDTSQTDSGPLPSPLPPRGIPAGLVAGISLGWLLARIYRNAELGLTCVGKAEGKNGEREGSVTCRNLGLPGKRSGTAAFPSICTVTRAVWKEEGRRCACLCVPGAGCTSVYVRLCRRALVASGASSGVASRNSQKLEGGERRTHPLPRKDLDDFESPLPHFSAPALLLLSSPLINGGAGSAGSQEPVCTRAGGRGRV